jgi:hypothetical protein
MDLGEIKTRNRARGSCRLKEKQAERFKAYLDAME